MTEAQDEAQSETVQDLTDPPEETEQGYVSPEIAAAQAGQVVVFEMTPGEPESESADEES